MISTLFSSLNTKTADNSWPEQGETMSDGQQRIQPVLFVMQKTMPIFKSIGEMFINQSSIIDVSARYDPPFVFKSQEENKKFLIL